MITLHVMGTLYTHWSLATRIHPLAPGETIVIDLNCTRVEFDPRESFNELSRRWDAQRAADQAASA